MTRRPVDARMAALAASRALLTVSTAALAAGALVRACPPSDAARPPEHRTPPPEADVERVLRAAGATAPAAAVWIWSPAHLDGDPGAEPLLRALRWVAPLGDPDAPVGTVTAWAPPAGGVRLAARDDDVDLARGLAALGPADAVVQDGDRWLVVTGDRVRWLASPAPAAPGTGPAGSTVPATVAGPVPGTVAGYRDARARERARGTDAP